MITTENVKNNINLVDFPMWDVNPKGNTRVRSVKTKRGTFTRRCGHGAPTQFDWLVLNALLRISQDQDFSRMVEISKLGLLKQSGAKGYSDWYYDRIKSSLRRWRHVGLEFEGTFYENKKWQPMFFGIITKVRINKHTKKLRVYFEKEFLDLIRESKYCKTFNFETMKKINAPTALRLYEYLDSKKQLISSNKGFKINVKELGDRLTISYTYQSEVIKEVKQVFNEVKKWLSFDIEYKLTHGANRYFLFKKVKKSTCHKNNF